MIMEAMWNKEDQNIEGDSIDVKVSEKQTAKKLDGTNGEEVTTKKGGFVTLPFILVSEACEKMAGEALTKNLMNFLREEVHMSVTKAAITLTNYKGTSSLTPLLGAIIADSFAGRFWTITIASVILQTGMVLLTLSAALPQLRPTPCDGNTECKPINSGHLAMIYIPLLLLALGSGGIRSCSAPFGADQFVKSDDNKERKNTNPWNFFNCYFFVMGISSFFALTVLVYVQDNVGWGWGLGILSIAMLLSTFIFCFGRPFYVMFDPSGSPFKRLLQVIVAAVRKRNLPLISHPRILYENNGLDKHSAGEKLCHSAHFKLLDKAAVVTEADFTAAGDPNLWKLSTIHRVEELKSMLRMIPIWASGIIFFMAAAQESTFSIEQANTMDRHLSKSFLIPSGSMSVFKMLSMVLTIALYDPIIIPLVKKFTTFNQNNSFLHKMAIGFAVSVIATLVAGFIEVKRKGVAIAHDLIEDDSHITLPISVFWLVPPYALQGIAEAFLTTGHLEFFYDQAPQSMRSTATALFWISSSAGNYLSSFLVEAVHNASHWLPDNINKGRLEYFYWLLTVLQVINFIYYIVCARQYTMKPVQVHCENFGSETEGRVEPPSQV